MCGDVITIQEDGWGWGAKEREQFWIVLRLGQPVKAMTRLLGRQVPHGCLPLYRAFYLDLVTLEICRRKTVPLVLEA